MLQQGAIAKRFITLLALRMGSYNESITFLNKKPNEDSEYNYFRKSCGNCKEN